MNAIDFKEQGERCAVALQQSNDLHNTAERTEERSKASRARAAKFVAEAAEYIRTQDGADALMQAFKTNFTSLDTDDLPLALTPLDWFNGFVLHATRPNEQGERPSMILAADSPWRSKRSFQRLLMIGSSPDPEAADQAERAKQAALRASAPSSASQQNGRREPFHQTDFDPTTGEVDPSLAEWLGQSRALEELKAVWARADADTRTVFLEIIGAAYVEQPAHDLFGPVGEAA
jgi:hypothetical protein